MYSTEQNGGTNATNLIQTVNGRDGDFSLEEVDVRSLGVFAGGQNVRQMDMRITSFDCVTRYEVDDKLFVRRCQVLAPKTGLSVDAIVAISVAVVAAAAFLTAIAVFCIKCK